MKAWISNSAQFWLYFVGVVPSIACSILILYHLLSNRTRRHAINNHIIIILLFNNLIYELINTPLFLNYYRLNVVRPSEPSLCVLWGFIDETLSSTSIVLVAWASIERHILIFHSQLLSSTRRRLLLHYIPLTVLLLYIVLFHAVVVLFPPCTNTYNYTQVRCGDSFCLLDSVFIGGVDDIINDIIPTLIIVIFSIALLVRCLLQNRHMHQHIQWRKYRKMAVQLLSIAILYFFLYIPIMGMELAKLCGASDEFINSFEPYTKFFSYYVIFLFPFSCLVTMPDILSQIKSTITRRNRTEPTVHLLKTPEDHPVLKSDQ